MASLGNTAVHGILDVIDSIHVGREKILGMKYNDVDAYLQLGGTNNDTIIKGKSYVKLEAPAIVYGDNGVNYGTTLPTDKIEGQLFFKIVDVDSIV